MHSANRESCDVAIVVMEEAEEPPTSEVAEDISPGKPTLGTAVQSPGYTVPEEATVGANWAPDCTPALPAPALRRGSQPRLTTWSLLCPHPSMIAPPVVGAGLAEDNNGAAVVEVAEGSPSLLASQTGQVGIQTLSRKTFLDACNEPTVIGRWPMLANSETGRRCRWDPTTMTIAGPT